MFKEIPHNVVYTDAAFHKHCKNLSYTLAQVPYHSSKKYLLHFLLGKIPAWRKYYSKKWLLKNISTNHSVIYAFVYSADCLFYAFWISQKQKIPLFVHLADHSRAFEQREVSNILKNCCKLICISEEMKYKYESMLGIKEIEVLHNGAEEQCKSIPSQSSPPFSKNNPFILCFLGGLFSHLHGDCIEDIFEAVSATRLNHPELEFHIYGQLQPNHFLCEQLKLTGVKHHGIVMPLDKRYEIMERAHCFVIPSSFNYERHNAYRYSFPTKLPELIATGRPILSYGPPDTATNKLLESHQFGIRINKRSTKALIQKLTSIIENYTLISQQSILRSSTIGRSFSAANIRKKLSYILESK